MAIEGSIDKFSYRVKRLVGVGKYDTHDRRPWVIIYIEQIFRLFRL